MSEGYELGTAKLFQEFATPFNAIKNAEHTVQFAIDPSKGLTKERFAWWSNGTQFDLTNFSEDPGEITLSTTATTTDEARIRSSFAGQYISQTLAEPGIRVGVDSANVEFDSNGYVSLSHGELYYGAFWWDAINNQVDTGFGVKIDSNAAYTFWVSDGVHFGDSPVPQNEWNLDDMSGHDDSDNPSGLQYDPSEGWVWNGPFTWYNAGKILNTFQDAEDSELLKFHQFVPRIDEPGKPSLSTANLPTQLVVRNNGTGTELSATLGGSQYSLYGASSSSGSSTTQQSRDTYGASESIAIDTQNNSPISPMGEPGAPLYSIKRDSNEKDLELQLGSITINTDNDIIVYFWDVYDDSATLTGDSFESTFDNNGRETKTQFDRSATAFTLQSNDVFRGMKRVDSTDKNKEGTVDVNVEDRIPIGATRVVTAVHTGTAAEANYIATNIEGY